jgi:hypothetical protein
MNWLAFALMTVASWGLYGICLHTGRMGMGDATNGAFKAFLLVGVAYFLVAVLAPLGVLWFRGASFSFPAVGVQWSLLAGLVGALGAFTVLLSFGAGGHPAVVMTLIFAGAPIVNALVGLLKHPPAGGIGAVEWPFYLGIALAAIGGGMVSLFKPV